MAISIPEPLTGETFFKKTKGLAEDKKFDVTTTDAGAICKLLIGKQSSSGKVVTCVPVKFEDTGRPTKLSNLIQHQQSVPLERL